MKYKLLKDLPFLDKDIVLSLYNGELVHDRVNMIEAKLNNKEL